VRKEEINKYLPVNQSLDEIALRPANRTGHYVSRISEVNEVIIIFTIENTYSSKGKDAFATMTKNLEFHCSSSIRCMYYTNFNSENKTVAYLQKKKTSTKSSKHNQRVRIEI